VRGAGEVGPRRVAVVTGTRADFGLLRTVMAAVEAHDELELMVIAAGAHLIQPATTYREVKKAFGVRVVDSVPMQVAGRVGRWADVESLGKGVARFGRSFERLRPDWVVVLGDRIEAFAAASAASVGGVPVAHLHGGDRAEGVADEAMRHAITKLAHLHLAATAASAERVSKMGEPEERIEVVGSPAIDGLGSIGPLSDADFAELGSPEAVVLLHPIGRDDEAEEHAATQVLAGVFEAIGGPVLALAPNHDPGRRGVLRALEDAGERLRVVGHLPREAFCCLLKRVGDSGGVLVGNSSAGLIEAAALRVPVVDIGDRQAGRERPNHCVHSTERASAVARAIGAALALDRSAIDHPYGDGATGERVAGLLASRDPNAAGVLRKQNAY